MMSNALANDVLKCVLKGTDPSWRADATQYLALISSASPDPADPFATELTYTGYARIAHTKATGWTDNGTNFTNAVLKQWGKRTDAGAVQTARKVVVVDTSSGAVAMAIIADLADDLSITQNVQPQCDVGTITITGKTSE